MVNLALVEAEDLAEATTDLVQQKHALQCILTIVLGTVLACCNDDRIVVIVAELAGVVTFDVRVVAEDRAIGVPLAHSGAVRHDSLL